MLTWELLRMILDKKLVCARPLKGKIQLGSTAKDVIIKTWNVFFPPEDTMKFYPLKLCDEIMFLTNDLVKSHQNVPQLIGYSIDKTFAVIYDLKSNKTLRLMLEFDYFGWDDRLEVAIQVACLMKDFHHMEIIIGSIDPYNIMIDADGNVKLCEFGLRDHMQKAEVFSCLCTGGAYTVGVPELYHEGKQTVKSDMYAFGHLLLELITKKPFGQVKLLERGPSLKRWAFQQLANGATSLVHKSFIDDDDVGSKITELVVNCLNEEPALGGKNCFGEVGEFEAWKGKQAIMPHLNNLIDTLTVMSEAKIRSMDVHAVMANFFCEVNNLASS